MSKPSIRVSEDTVNALCNRIDYLDGVVLSPSVDNYDRWQSEASLRNVREAQRKLSRIVNHVNGRDGRADAQWLNNLIFNTGDVVCDAMGRSAKALQDRAYEKLEY